ncbi:MAG: superoxide dismutase [Prolixibacteraceae bacterium]|nr:superoxide dismutase [Prolixibacteraceae bacterium]
MTTIILTNVTVSKSEANDKPIVKHEFPALPYAYNSLEPYIDAQTMELHYSKHHRTYYDNFIKAITGTELENKELEEIFSEVSKASPSVRNMGGGYYNHVIFWNNLSPETGVISSELAKVIDENFGSFNNFKEAFNKASTSVFGSGWAWLIVSEKDNKLKIITTANQDNPLMDVVSEKGFPLLTIDVWEHAYYLKYQNKRAEYINAFWNVVNWNEVSKRFEEWQKSNK